MRRHAQLAATVLAVASLAGGAAVALRAEPGAPAASPARTGLSREDRTARPEPAVSADRGERRTAGLALAAPGTPREPRDPRGASTLAGSAQDPGLAEASPDRSHGVAIAATTAKDGTRPSASATARGDRRGPAPSLATIRAGLASLDPHVRLAALRAAREAHAPELEADAALVLAHDGSTPCRRVAAQILAQGDAAAHAEQLASAVRDPDPVVQLNATFGLARSGDEARQALLLVECEVARRRNPELVPYVATMLEDPALRSPAVLERFRVLSQSARAAPEARARALDVLRAKGS